MPPRCKNMQRWQEYAEAVQEYTEVVQEYNEVDTLGVVFLHPLLSKGIVQKKLKRPSILILYELLSQI